MFVWMSSDGNGPRWGCCGGWLLILPLGFLLMFGGLGRASTWLLALIVGALLAMVVLPRLMARPAGEKRKNDEYYDEYDEKPKREDRYLLTDDGEIIEANEDDEPDQRGNDIHRIG